jgi:hypothetical protein
MPENTSPKRRTRTLLLRAVTLGTSAVLGTAACGGSVGTASDAGNVKHVTGTAPEEAGHPMGLAAYDGGGDDAGPLGLFVDAGLSVDDAGDDGQTEPMGLGIPDAGEIDAVAGTIVQPGGKG